MIILKGIKSLFMNKMATNICSNNDLPRNKIFLFESTSRLVLVNQTKLTLSCNY